MRHPPLLLTLLLVALVAGTVFAVVARAWSLDRAAQGQEIAYVVFDRVDHTVTVPPEHNARATYGMEPQFKIRRRHEKEFKARLDAFRPRVLEALQILLSRIHYTVLQRGEGRDLLAVQVRTEVNSILGGEFVEEVDLLHYGR